MQQVYVANFVEKHRIATKILLNHYKFPFDVGIKRWTFGFGR
jgi:hypothetical protein